MTDRRVRSRNTAGVEVGDVNVGEITGSLKAAAEGIAQDEIRRIVPSADYRRPVRAGLRDQELDEEPQMNEERIQGCSSQRHWNVTVVRVVRQFRDHVQRVTNLDPSSPHQFRIHTPKASAGSAAVSATFPVTVTVTVAGCGNVRQLLHNQSVAIQVAVCTRAAASSPAYAGQQPASIDVHRRAQNGRSGLLIYWSSDHPRRLPRVTGCHAGRNRFR